jgi:hypothetical protein
MKIKSLLLSTLVFLFTNSLVSQSEGNSTQACSSVHLEVGKYENTIDEFYGSIKAVYQDQDVEKYKDYYESLQNAIQIESNTTQRALYSTIQSLWDKIETAYQAESQKDKKFTELFKKSYERIESQFSSIHSKVKDLKKSGCENNRECECYLGQIDPPCSILSATEGCTSQIVDQYYQYVNEFYNQVKVADIAKPQSLQKGQSSYPKYFEALNAAVVMDSNIPQRAMSNTLKSLWGDIESAYKYYSSKDEEFIKSFDKTYAELKAKMSLIDKMVSSWKSAGCKDNCSWNCYLGVYGTRCGR